MISNARIDQVMDKFFTAIKSKEDYEIEGTGLTYHFTLDLLKSAAKDSIKDNPEKFENLVKWLVHASMFLLDDIKDLDEIDLQLRGAI